MNVLLLEVVFILLGCVSNGLAKEAYGCVTSSIRLECNWGETISISSMQLGDSRCFQGACCPRTSDCFGPVSGRHRFITSQLCEGKRTCQVAVESRNIGCGLLFPHNDYQLISYECISIILTSTFIAPTTFTSTTATTTSTTSKTSSSSSPSTPPSSPPPSPPLSPPPASPSAPPFFLSTTQQPESQHIQRESVLQNESTQDDRELSDDVLDFEDEPHVAFLHEPPSLQNNHYEKIVTIIVAGVILMTIIVSLTCLLVRRMYLKGKTRQGYLMTLPRPPIDPPPFVVSYSSTSLAPLPQKCLEESEECHSKSNPLSDVNHCIPNVYEFETYDSIGDVDLKLPLDSEDHDASGKACLIEDDYLRPNKISC